MLYLSVVNFHFFPTWRFFGSPCFSYDGLWSSCPCKLLTSVFLTWRFFGSLCFSREDLCSLWILRGGRGGIGFHILNGSCTVPWKWFFRLRDFVGSPCFSRDLLCSSWILRANVRVEFIVVFWRDTFTLPLKYHHCGIPTGAMYRVYTCGWHTHFWSQGYTYYL